MGPMSDMSQQSNAHTLANARMWLVKENGIIGEKINGSCLKTCPILHQGNCWNFPRKWILSALDLELAHLATLSDVCSKTSRAAPPCSHTIILWSSAKKPGFHLPCLRMTFNLLSWTAITQSNWWQGSGAIWSSHLEGHLFQRPAGTPGGLLNNQLHSSKAFGESFPPKLQTKVIKCNLQGRGRSQKKQVPGMARADSKSLPSSDTPLPTHQPPCTSSLCKVLSFPPRFKLEDIPPHTHTHPWHPLGGAWG